MGDENDNQEQQGQEQDQQPQGWAVFAGAFADGSMDPTEPDEGEADPGAGDPPAGGDGAAPGGEPAQPTQPAAPAAQPAQPAAPETPVPTWANQEEAGRSFKALRDEKALKEGEAAFWQAVARGEVPNPFANGQPAAQPAQQPAAADADPEPDASNYTEDAAYWKDVRAWDRRQVAKELRAEMAPIAQTQQRSVIQANLNAHAGQVGKEAFDRYWKAVDELSNDVPELAQKILKSQDPGAEVVKLGRKLLGEASGGTPTATPATPAPAAPAQPVAVVPAIPLTPQGTLDMAAIAANPAIQEAVLQAVAAQRAAAGAAPPTPNTPTLPPGPRGLGPVGGAPVPDAAVTVEGIRAMNDPQALRSVMGQLAATLLA